MLKERRMIMIDIKIVYHNDPGDDIGAFIDRGFTCYAEKFGIDVDYEIFAFTAEENGRIVGVVQGHSYYKEVHISELIVDEKYRGRDIGTKLIQTVEEHFSGKGLENINLTTYGFQAPEFYKKSGFEVEYIRKSKYEPDLDKYFMVKYF